MKKVVIFDLDGTLVRGQSQRLFMNYLFGKGLVRAIPCAKLYCWFILHKIGLAKDPEKAMRYAFSFFKNWRVDMMEILVQDFMQSTLQENVYAQGKELIAEHDPTECHLILLSNAFESLSKTAAEQLGISSAFGTTLESSEGRFTGRLSGQPLFGNAKAEFIKRYVEKHHISLKGSWAYGDSISDLPVLELVDNPVAVNPDRKLYREALIRNWPIIRFEG